MKKQIKKKKAKEKPKLEKVRQTRVVICGQTRTYATQEAARKATIRLLETGDLTFIEIHNVWVDK